MSNTKINITRHGDNSCLFCSEISDYLVTTDLFSFKTK